VDNLTEGELSWIQQQAAETPGFVDFKQRHNQRLDNPTRVSYWKFAAAFCSKYYKAQWPSHIDQSVCALPPPEDMNLIRTPVKRKNHQKECD
jgi:hypothetical protein